MLTPVSILKSKLNSLIARIIHHEAKHAWELTHGDPYWEDVEEVSRILDELEPYLVPASIYTIQGGAGAGKSYTAQELTSTLGGILLSTGRAYRTATHVALTEHLAVDVDADREKLIATLKANLKPKVLRNEGYYEVAFTYKNRVLTPQELDNPEVDGYITQVAAAIHHEFGIAFIKSVLEHLKIFGKSIVMEGRNTAELFAPEAEVKIEISAEPLVKGRRRLGQYIENMQHASRISRIRALEVVYDNWVKGTGMTFEERLRTGGIEGVEAVCCTAIQEDLLRRDREDEAYLLREVFHQRTRERIRPEMILIDTTPLNKEQAFSQSIDLIIARLISQINHPREERGFAAYRRP